VSIAVAGENIIDLVPIDGEEAGFRALPGGSPANVAIAAARLGTQSSLIARIGGDAFGARVRRRLDDDDVLGRYLVDSDDPSSLAVVTFDAERRARYDFWVSGTADALWRDEELPDPLAEDVQALHVGSIGLHLQPGGDSLMRLTQREAARGAVTVTLDPNIRPDVVAGGLSVVKARLEALAPSIHVVKVSDEDLALLHPGLPMEEAARHWLTLGPSLVVVTQGAQGVYAVTDTYDVTLPAPEIKLVDTVGAGDTFTGAMLHMMGRAGLLGGANLKALREVDRARLEEVLTYAAVAAAINCEREGADPPTALEIDEWQAKRQ
jgi:fructokinase